VHGHDPDRPGRRLRLDVARILEYIKSHLPDSKVLVMSSASGIETRKACFAVGADEFLEKPFETEKLLSTMRRMAPRSLEFV